MVWTFKYLIKLKDGHSYEINNYRRKEKVKTEITKEGVEVLIMEVQYKPRQRYKTIRIIPHSIQYTNIDELQEMMIGID